MSMTITGTGTGKKHERRLTLLVATVAVVTSLLCFLPTNVVSSSLSTTVDTGKEELVARLYSLGLPVPGIVADCVLEQCDGLDDFLFLTDRQIHRCCGRRRHKVKAARLIGLRSELQRQSESERTARDRAARRWDGVWRSAVSTVESLTRGFMLGCSGSFLYETLVFSKNFYAATSDELYGRIRNATVRAGVIGVFSACASIGLAMFVPRGMREAFSTLNNNF